MKKNFYRYLEKKLNNLKKSSLYRELKNLNDGNRETICFSSNDYLGFARNPYLIEKTIADVKECGLGSTGSKLISGYHSYHIRLEEELTKLKEREKALIFGSGYLANIALLSTLPSSKDLILSDKLNHASIIDGCRLSRASAVEYPHLNIAWVERYLKKNRDKFNFVFIVSDAVFSMDGDIVPLVELYKIAENFNAVVILDEAHSSGVLGTNGRGIESYFGVHNEDSIIMGTLGKAFGSYGAFVCGKSSLIDFLVNKARPLIYSTSLPPAPCIAAYNAVRLMQKDASFINRLRNNIAYLREGLISLGIDCPSTGPIFPIPSSHHNTMELEESLLSMGVFVKGIRPPTVPHGKSRLRLTISARHSKEEIDFLIEAISRVYFEEFL